MNRVDFVKTLMAMGALNTVPIFDVFPGGLEKNDPVRNTSLGPIPATLAAEFAQFADWMKKSGWEAFLMKNAHLPSIAWTDYQSLCSIITTIDKAADGLDDFAGTRLIEPGNPSLSLMYHVLASPRVTSTDILNYPTLLELEVLENFIYGLKSWDDYAHENQGKSIQLMVLAYEYRPAFKTPALGINNFEKWSSDNKPDFPRYAQLVFSRTAISRVGSCPMNFDAKSRSFTNLPLDTDRKKEGAVTPSRYAVFLVELTELKKNKGDVIKVMNIQRNEFTTFQGSHTPLNRHFIRPIRKLYEDDTFSLHFAQYHMNQKLFRFSQFERKGKKIGDVNASAKWDVNTYPFRRIDCTDDHSNVLQYNAIDRKLVELVRNGSSVLLSPFPSKLVNVATQNGNALDFYVEQSWEKRYNALKLTNEKNVDIYDGFFTEYLYRKHRLTSRFRAMRNAPLFTNIKYVVDKGVVTHLDEHSNNMEASVEASGYRALLYEDNLCDGCVSAKVSLKAERTLPGLLKSLSALPGFSIVSAPDFFPYLDSNDIRKYYHSGINKYKTVPLVKTFPPPEEQEQEQQQFDITGLENDEHFIEGGSLNLSGIRQRGNPDIIDPFTGEAAFADSFLVDKSFDTLMAVVSNADKDIPHIPAHDFSQNFRRNYQAGSFLPDTGTGIFYPGWDITYSGEKINPYFATFGLGSPFPEDMKLCAAANGMWPVASPDAGRTFQGSLSKFPLLGRPNTSIPLMDDEIGYHASSPHVLQHGKTYSYGWDGEQGPYLVADKKATTIVNVNFTDIGRADYVENLLDSNIGFDMSRLRTLSSGELIDRMDCLRKAVKEFNNRKVAQTRYWLISAEKVNDWKQGADAAGVPDGLVGDSNEWAKTSKGLAGKGFLFVFALTRPKKISLELERQSKRRNQLVTGIVVCKVSSATKDSHAVVEWTKFDTSKIPEANEIKWK
jgi:hypothetical protein